MWRSGWCSLVPRSLRCRSWSSDAGSWKTRGWRSRSSSMPPRASTGWSSRRGGAGASSWRDRRRRCLDGWRPASGGRLRSSCARGAGAPTTSARSGRGPEMRLGCFRTSSPRSHWGRCAPSRAGRHFGCCLRRSSFRPPPAAAPRGSEARGSSSPRTAPSRPAIGCGGSTGASPRGRGLPMSPSATPSATPTCSCSSTPTPRRRPVRAGPWRPRSERRSRWRPHTWRARIASGWWGSGPCSPACSRASASRSCIGSSTRCWAARWSSPTRTRTYRSCHGGCCRRRRS